MCSTYTYTKNEAKLRLREKIEVFGAVRRESIRPTDLAPVIVPESESFVCRDMNWGWSVPWDKGPFINAKSETLTTLPLYRSHLNDRCLILTDGFYEGGALFYQPGKSVFCLAGLWREESGVKKFTMLTTSPNESVAKFHHRMPFILRPEQCDLWLGNDWLEVLKVPDHAPLEKFQKQPELF